MKKVSTVYLMGLWRSFVASIELRSFSDFCMKKSSIVFEPICALLIGKLFPVGFYTLF